MTISLNSLFIAQSNKLLTGNEAIIEAIRVAETHFMGYYPITPSTEIAEGLDQLRARGEINTVLLAADGEHGAAGACFGASTTGARVVNATSANGFLYSLEQMPVQAGTRLPMVLNLVTRSVSGPLDIRCDHSDLMFALQTGWLLLCASTPQAAYDLNLIAVKLGEHPDVRLPVIVATDGFFTSHERNRVDVFDDLAPIREWLKWSPPELDTIHPERPITVGPYMNDQDLIHNKIQLHQAHERARKVYDEIVHEYKQFSGRNYPALECTHIEEAQSAIFLINSSAETTKDALEASCARGEKVGLIRPNLLRPFPTADLQAVTHHLRSIVIGERSDTPGSEGGPISHEVRSALFTDHHSDMNSLIRVYGLGGMEYTDEDAQELIHDALIAANPQNTALPRFAFIGGERRKLEKKSLPKLWDASQNDREPSSRIQWPKTKDPSSTMCPEPILPSIAELALVPKRIAPGHGACPGCGIFSSLDQFFKGIEGDIVVLYHTGCAMVVTTDYPFSAHRVSYVHNLFQNGAPTLAGLVEAFQELKRRGQIQGTRQELTFIMISGDGGMDIGLGPALGTALRGHKIILLEYDNQGYMNTGGQLSYSTPQGKITATSHAGTNGHGKTYAHRDTPQLFVHSGAKYVFTAGESFSNDFIRKAAKAQWMAREHGFVYGKTLITCPLHWKTPERLGTEMIRLAVETCFFPLYEVEHGKTTINHNPDETRSRVPLRDWVSQMGVWKHLLLPQNEQILLELEKDVDFRWRRLIHASQFPG